METVLGLSMTSTSVAWILLDRQNAQGAALDHDAFDVFADVITDGDISRHLAALRGAQAIATSSGHQVSSIGVTWTDEVDATASVLLKALPDWGFDDVVAVRGTQATREWAQAVGHHLGVEKCAVCIIESAAAAVLYVDAGDGTVQTSVTHMRESADGLARWLTEVFDGNQWQPDSLFLVGSRGDLELISGSLEEALPMPVVSSDDAQLALARGAALALSANTDVATAPVDTEPVADATAPRPFRSHVGAAAVIVAGAIALFAIGPEFAGQQESGTANDQPAANSPASVTSATSVSSATPASVRAVSPPAASPTPPAVRPLAAPPPPEPAQPEALPPSVVAFSPEPDQVIATPVVAPIAASQEPIAAPVEVPQAPIAPPPAVVPPAPIVPPPAPPPPPPSDPIAVVLSPIFGALP